MLPLQFGEVRIILWLLVMGAAPPRPRAGALSGERRPGY